MKDACSILRRILIFTLLITGTYAYSEPLPLKHSHNDYEQLHPLFDALSLHFESVEADIWLRQGQLLVSHNGIHFKGSLEDLYLRPLREHALNNGGSVYGDAHPFFLWLDIKDHNKALVQVLQTLLQKYADVLTVYTGDHESAGPISIILTGEKNLKTYYTEHYVTRYATRDSNEFSESDPDSDSRWLWYSLDFTKYVKRDPSALSHLVEEVHKKRRQIRFWNSPDQPDFWTLALGAQVNMIGTDKLSDLSRFLAEKPHRSLTLR